MYRPWLWEMIKFCIVEITVRRFQLQGDGTKIIDLEGKLVLPGTFDAHIHAAYAGLSLSLILSKWNRRMPPI